MKTAVRTFIPRSLRCPLCHDGFRPEDSGGLVRCEGCRAIAHDDCRRELGGCGTLGCSRGPRRARPRPRPPQVTRRPGSLTALIYLRILKCGFLSAMLISSFVPRLADSIPAIVILGLVITGLLAVIIEG